MEIYEKVDWPRRIKSSIAKGNRRFLIICIVSLLVAAALPESLAEAGPFISYVGLPLLLVWSDGLKDFRDVFKLRKLSLTTLPMLTILTVLSIPVTTWLLNVSVLVIGDQMGFLFDDMLKQPTWILVFVLCIFPGFTEEFVLRGLMMDSYKSLGWKAQVVMSGVLFGLFHMNVNQFSYSLFLGMILALAVLITKSIWASVYIHFLNNFISVMMVKMSVPEPEAAAMGAAEWVVLTVIAVVCLYLMGMAFDRLTMMLHDRKTNDLLDRMDEEWSEAHDGCSPAKWTTTLTVSFGVVIVLFVLFSILTVFLAQNPNI